MNSVMEAEPWLNVTGYLATNMDKYISLSNALICTNMESFNEIATYQNNCDSHYLDVSVTILVPLVLEHDHKQLNFTNR